MFYRKEKSADNHLLALIDSLYAENKVLRNQIEERKTKINTLRQELELSQKATKQFSTAYFEMSELSDKIRKKICCSCKP